METKKIADKRSSNRGPSFQMQMKVRRNELGLTQSELAEKAKVSVDLIRAIERGRSCNPSFFVAVDIMKALEMDLGKEVAKWAGVQID